MVEPTPTPFEPDYAVLPGETLNETLERTGMSQTALAERTGLSRKTINGIINGSEPLTPDTAIALEKVFGVPARFWINLQKNYDEASARLRERERMRKVLTWIKEEEIPYAELVKRKAVPDTRDPVDRLVGALTFYGVASPERYRAIWEETQRACNFRKSDKHHVRFGAVSAWLRLGELQASLVPCETFRKARLESAVGSIRAEAANWIGESQSRLRESLAACGVALVFVPAIVGAPIYGATRWLTAEKAIVQMSLRGKDDGNFWFTLFHELGHILLHGRRDVFLEMDQANPTGKEQQADAYARDQLIPRQEFEAFIRAHDGRLGSPRSLFLSKSDILAFASQVRVAPGVVVGRLQRDGWLPHTHCNDLKVRLRFSG